MLLSFKISNFFISEIKISKSGSCEGKDLIQRECHFGNFISGRIQTYETTKISIIHILCNLLELTLKNDNYLSVKKGIRPFGPEILATIRDPTVGPKSAANDPKTTGRFGIFPRIF